ncbi:5-formyltetrahydrofolate cyclo-ligase [Marinomonas sp. M1K-6]|uniref:5-formyltetrahydrofolate cyclo-ligase n=1 Tax=Marinomonas profundi TaxID=2726122 RepID=A0A847QYT4_9GAMM|nr:5-formyltetrahydrofolate cyclo-ligase [Marinomonas profundi]NLQ18309.1 5-formyltetrahydrofolate cyclo-ligase [Marinomonas profundi]UDV02372.1 5-formyltetrahydrofolate cyclo-ligase [Marinomonas profundi]
MTSHLDPRQTLRRQLRQSRRNLSADEQLIAATELLSCFKQQLSHAIENTQRIALYLSNDGEISPHLLCEYFWQNDIETYLPVVQDKQLTFARYTAETVWQENIFGIKEPLTADYLSGDELDIVLLPLVGFDSKGGRLGMGGGFYDRTFADKRADKSPRLIGMAHDCQEVKSLPVEGWDVPLQAVITPTQLILV